MPTGRPRHCVWEVCKTIEVQLLRILPCSSSEQWLPLGWPCHYERFVCQRNWGAYLERLEHYAHKYPRTRHKQSTVNRFHPSLRQAAFSQRNQISEGYWDVSIRHKSAQSTGLLYLGPSSLPPDISPTLFSFCCKTWENHAEAPVGMVALCRKLPTRSGCLKEWFDILGTVLICFLAKWKIEQIYTTVKSVH